MDNLLIYNQSRAVPETAIKPIKGGRLKGMSDINPMWRIKKLTEIFGPCGIGWKYDIIKQWAEPGADGNICAFCDINLYYKHDGAWSDGVPGTGGAMLVSKESGGLYTDDECYKKALTDAISVSAKALGIGADVYFEKDKSKYDLPEPDPVICHDCNVEIKPGKRPSGKAYPPQEIAKDTTKKFGVPLCIDCAGKRANAN